MKEEYPNFYYQADKRFCYLIYENRSSAMSGWAAKTNLSEGQRDAESWSRAIGAPVSYTNPEDMIYVFKIENTIHNYTNLWHVIVGNKIGWIIIRDQDRFVKVMIDE